jgi:SPP1 family predicted phage head-tail adaptor
VTVGGKLRHRITFEKRADVDDGYGNTQAGWAVQFTVWAEVKAKLGGEAVTAARLQSQNTVNITVRASSQTRLIREDWRARDQSEGIEYAIKSIIDLDDGGAWLELLCQTGAAA